MRKEVWFGVFLIKFMRMIIRLNKFVNLFLFVLVLFLRDLYYWECWDGLYFIVIFILIYVIYVLLFYIIVSFFFSIIVYW